MGEKKSHMKEILFLTKQLELLIILPFWILKKNKKKTEFLKNIYTIIGFKIFYSLC